jgi:hypothetical protein
MTSLPRKHKIIILSKERQNFRAWIPLMDTYGKIAAFPSCARRVRIQHTSRGVAARIIAAVLQTAVTLLADFNKTVPADRTVEQSVDKLKF